MEQRRRVAKAQDQLESHGTDCIGIHALASHAEVGNTTSLLPYGGAVRGAVVIAWCFSLSRRFCMLHHRRIFDRTPWRQKVSGYVRFKPRAGPLTTLSAAKAWWAMIGWFGCALGAPPRPCYPLSDLWER